jgi:hypothetical protein
MDMTGTWTDGSRAELMFRPPPDVDGDLIAFVRAVEAFLGVDDEPIRINAYLDGVQLARWKAQTRHAALNYRLVLPYEALKDKPMCRLAFEIENPQSAHLMATRKGRQVIGEDPRELGVRIQRVSFSGVDRLGYSLRSVIDFTKRGTGVFHLNECWTHPDRYGAWTLGPDASLVLYLDNAPEHGAIAAFTASDAAVNEEHPYVDVAVSFNGRKMADWSLGPSRVTVEKEVFVPGDVLRSVTPLTVFFHVKQPRSPVQLKWSETDTRQLGFRLTRFRMDAVETSAVPRLEGRATE